MNTIQNNPFNNPQQYQESVIVKLIFITLIVLGLLIPSFWINSLVEERQNRQREVVADVSSKWASAQTVTGPVLRIPYKIGVPLRNTGNYNEDASSIEKYFYLTPDMLTIDANIDAKVLNRTIFKVPVYNSEVTMKGSFKFNEQMLMALKAIEIDYANAGIFIGISDLKGIEQNPQFNIFNSMQQLEPGEDSQYIFSENLFTPLDLTESQEKPMDFVVKMKIKGSEMIRFMTIGKTTALKLNGNWPHPKFDGLMLPNDREVSEKGFSASWNVLHFNRNLPQTWTSDSRIKDHENTIGAELYTPVDHYQLNMRSSKYSHLIIILSFAAMFLVEMIKKVKIHPIQYLLIGFALVLYYSLMIALSEHIGFSLSYLIASVATTILVGCYSTSFLVPKKMAILLVSILLLFYAFIFVVINAQDIALLLGSIALFAVLASIMYFSKDVKWYKEPVKVAEI